MRILVNSTPLIGLCKIGKLDILRAVYAPTGHPSGGTAYSLPARNT